MTVARRAAMDLWQVGTIGIDFAAPEPMSFGITTLS